MKIAAAILIICIAVTARAQSAPSLVLAGTTPEAAYKSAERVLARKTKRRWINAANASEMTIAFQTHRTAWNMGYRVDLHVAPRAEGGSVLTFDVQRIKPEAHALLFGNGDSEISGIMQEIQKEAAQ